MPLYQDPRVGGWDIKYSPIWRTFSGVTLDHLAVGLETGLGDDVHGELLVEGSVRGHQGRVGHQGVVDPASQGPPSSLFPRQTLQGRHERCLVLWNPVGLWNWWGDGGGEGGDRKRIALVGVWAFLKKATDVGKLGCLIRYYIIQSFPLVISNSVQSPLSIVV